MRKIKTWRDPYDAGFSTCRPKTIQIESGITVLVGCNGAGKSTLLQNISEVLCAEKVPYVKFDNLDDGGHNGLSRASFEEQFELMSTMMTSSEGENITINISQWVSNLRSFVYSGRYRRGGRHDRMVDAFRSLSSSDTDTSEADWLQGHKERWFLIDAADSGYSIDNVIDLKRLLNLIQTDCCALNKECYIVISANEYELASGEKCFDVNSGKYITFSDYEEYKKFILKSRKLKDRRYSKIEERTSNEESD